MHRYYVIVRARASATVCVHLRASANVCERLRARALQIQIHKAVPVADLQWRREVNVFVRARARTCIRIARTCTLNVQAVSRVRVRAFA